MNKRLSLVLSLAALTGFSQTGMATPPSVITHAVGRKTGNPDTEHPLIHAVAPHQVKGNTDVRSNVFVSGKTKVGVAAGTRMDILTRDGKLSPSYTAALKAAPPKINVLGTSATKLTATQAQGLFGNTAEFVTGNMAKSKDSVVIAFGQSGVPYSTSDLSTSREGKAALIIATPLILNKDGSMLSGRFKEFHKTAPKTIGYGGKKVTMLSVDETTAFYTDLPALLRRQAEVPNGKSTPDIFVISSNGLVYERLAR